MVVVVRKTVQMVSNVLMESVPIPPAKMMVNVEAMKLVAMVSVLRQLLKNVVAQNMFVAKMKIVVKKAVKNLVKSVVAMESRGIVVIVVPLPNPKNVQRYKND
jgi:hypothetical protein